jgi:beta-glucanase (GH16 family)
MMLAWTRVAAAALLLGGLVMGAGRAEAGESRRAILPSFDTTQSLVSQDGDDSGITTLATCPMHCEGNPRGERNAVLSFDVLVPSNATVESAQLTLSAWQPFDARMSVYVGNGSVVATRDGVVAGANAFDVTRAVNAGGRYTFVVKQSSHDSRIYWASSENVRTELRPRLALRYKTGTSNTPTGWKLVWNDEFNDNTIDRAKWNARDSRVDFDKACITSRPENLFEGNGYLTIRARAEQYTCGPETRPYTVGYLDTIGKHTFTYGRFEVRAKSPSQTQTSKGLWPAFWLRPQDGGNGEIDVVELPGGPQYYDKATQAIFRDYTPTKQDVRTAFPNKSVPLDGFHVYATEWDAQSIRWYIDGVKVWERTPQTTSWYTEVFNKPYNLRLNFQVGGWLGDPDASTKFPADFQVDYVRVYQK